MCSEASSTPATRTGWRRCSPTTRCRQSILHLITGSLGGALAVGQQIGGVLGTELTNFARQSFVSGLDLAVTVGAVVVGTAGLVVLIVLPNRSCPTRAGPSQESTPETPAPTGGELAGRHAALRQDSRPNAQSTRSGAVTIACMPADLPTILATSGGLKRGSRTDFEFAPLVIHAIELSGVNARRPRLCHIGTAGGDQLWWNGLWDEAGHAAGIDVVNLNLFPMPDVEDVAGFLLDQDVIWVGGGSVANLLAIWRLHGLDRILAKVWQAGVVLAGSVRRLVVLARRRHDRLLRTRIACR